MIKVTFYFSELTRIILIKWFAMELITAFTMKPAFRMNTNR